MYKWVLESFLKKFKEDIEGFKASEMGSLECLNKFLASWKTNV